MAQLKEINMNDLADILHTISYSLVGFVGSLLGVSWSFVRLMEVSLEAFLVGCLGGLGAAFAKFIFEFWFYNKDKKRY